MYKYFVSTLCHILLICRKYNKFVLFFSFNTNDIKCNLEKMNIKILSWNYMLYVIPIKYLLKKTNGRNIFLNFIIIIY